MENDFNSPPCLVVGNSQIGEELPHPRSTHLKILTGLSISKAPLEKAKVFACSEGQCDPQPQAGNGGAGDGNSDHNNSGSDGGGGGSGSGGGGSGSGGGGSGGDASGDDGGGDGGGGGGGGDGGNGSAGDDTTSHESQQPSSSDDCVPQLVPAGPIPVRETPLRCIPASDLVQATLSDSSSINRSSTSSGSAISPEVHEGDAYSQASTDVVGGAGDIANVSDVHSVGSGPSLSEASTTAADRRSNSTVSIGSKSDHKSGGSSSGSSVYPADTSSLSSLSSVATLPSSPEVLQRLQLNPFRRTQSTSDTSSSSAGSKEAKSHSHTEGYAMIKSIEEDRAEGSASKSDDTEICSSQEDLFDQVSAAEAHKSGGGGQAGPLSSQEVSRLCTPQHMSTPMGSSQKSQEPPREKSLYKQVLTKQASSTPLEDSESHIVPTPPSDGFNCLQFSGSVRETSSSSDAQISPSPESFVIIPSSPTAGEDESPPHTSLAPEMTDDEVVLPHWQEKVLKEKTAEEKTKEQNVNVRPSSSAEVDSTPESSSKDNFVAPESHPWQSAVTEESSGSNGVMRRDMCPTGEPPSRPQVLFLEDSEVLPTVFDNPTNGEGIITAAEQEPSLSPSSLVLDPEVGLADARLHYRRTGGSLAAQGPSQLEMSQDLFQPSIFLEETARSVCMTEGLEKSGPPDAAEESEFQSSFSLHFTPSQREESSQVLTDTSQNVEVMTSHRAEMGPPTEGPTDSARQHKDPEAPLQVKPNQELSASFAEKEVGSLSKQESTESQSILAPVIFGELASGVDREKESGADRSDVPLLQAKQATCSQAGLLAAERNTESSSHREGVDKNFVSIADTPFHEAAATENDPPALCTETSSESASGLAFHFSLPPGGEPLRPTTCTTPSPVQSTRETAPEEPRESLERFPLVSETPGMSGEAPAKQTQERSSVLTLTMPRKETPEESDVDNSEPAFLFERPPQAPSTSRIPRPSPKSIFSRAREVIQARKQEARNELLSDNDPFSFSSEEGRGPPVKRPRRGEAEGDEREERRKPDSGRKKARGHPSSSRGKGKVLEQKMGQTSRKREMAPEVHTTHTQAPVPSCSREGEVIDKSLEQPLINEATKQPKKSRNDEVEPRPGPSSASDDISSEPVRFRQVIRTRTIKTVTVAVQHIVTVKTVDKATGELVNVLTYEENEQPKVECEEQETEEEGEIVESARKESPAQNTGLLLSTSHEKEGRQSQSPRGKRAKLAESGGREKYSAERRRRGNVAERMSDEVEGSTVGTAFGRPSLTRQDTQPVKESSSDVPIEPGTRVLARWLDGYFYPGRVVGGPSESGQYNVSFDDGHRRKIPRKKLIVKDLLPVGQGVLVQGPDASYEEGHIVGYCRTRGERGYEIERNDGKVERSPVSQVILSAKQAAVILSSSSSVNITTTSSGSSTELRSLRSKRCSIERYASPVLFSGDTSSKDTSGESSEREARQKKASPSANLPRTAKKGKASDGSETPKSSLKRKFKSRGARGKKPAETSSETSSDENRKRIRRGLSLGANLPSTSDAVPTLRRSPRKHVVGQGTESDTARGLETTGTCPLPRDRNLFAGLAFLITSVQHSKESEESDSESENVAFDRANLTLQIEAGGGTLMTSFSQTREAEGLFLISNAFQRTQKYFLSLASGIPCVSHVWIHDSCISNVKRDFRKYLLPSGKSLETGEIVEYRLRRGILRNMTIFFHGSKDFRETWSSVACAAGCSVVAKLPNRPARAAQARELDYKCDVVVCGKSNLPTRIQHAIDVLGIPAVSIQWLLQCLINGGVVRFDGHPKYHYKYKEA